MKTIASLIACLVVSSALAAIAAFTRLDLQLRSDLQSILAAHWTPQKVREGGEAYVETWLAELKTAYPQLLVEEAEPAVPTEEQLLKAQADASRRRGAKAKGEIWTFYQERWQQRLLSADQRILFGRLLSAVIAETKEPKRMVEQAEERIRQLEAELQRLKKEKG